MLTLKFFPWDLTSQSGTYSATRFILTKIQVVGRAE